MAVDYILTTNMSLTVPVTGTALGPDWANEINACFVVIDSHDHSQGKGVQITPSGLDINADLPLQGNNLTQARTVRLQAPNSQPAGATDLTCLYAFGVDLYYRDGSGNQVRITQSGSVTGAAGNITNLVSPASVTYVGAGATFVFQSVANTSANLDGASVILRNLSANSKGLTLSPPAAMAADYTITLPALPAATSLISINTSGAMSTTTPDGSTIVNTGTVLKIPDGAITAALIAAGFGLVPSGVISAFGGTVAPTGYLLCDGTSYLRADYPTLFTAIGTAYGTADGTHFNVPDSRGRFWRGVDGSANRDPNHGTRTAMNAGGNTGNNVGSVQSDAFASHSHDIFTALAGSGAKSTANGDTYTGTEVTQATGGSETRPINAYCQFIIKT